jgi:hypothetical protein
MVLGGMGTVVYGVDCVVVAAHGRIDTAAGLELYGARLTRGVLLVTGGVFACMVGGHVCRVAWNRGNFTGLGHALLVGGYLLVVAGLVVFARQSSAAGVGVGLGIQVVGAVAVGVGGSRVRDGRRPRPSGDPGTWACGGAGRRAEPSAPSRPVAPRSAGSPASRRLGAPRGLRAIGGRFADKTPRGGRDATPPG